MIVLVGGEKGGTGKSTIATNLAAWLACAGADVLLVDTDPQGTSAAWASERAQNSELARVACAQRFGDVFEDVRDWSTRYDEVVVDAGGRDSEELRSAIVVADLLISPVKPSQSDLWTVDKMAALVRKGRNFNRELAALIVLSMAPTNPRINEAAEASEMLSQNSDLKLSDVLVRERKAYRDAMCEGRGVVELRDPKATSEICALAKGIYSGREIQREAA